MILLVPQRVNPRIPLAAPFGKLFASHCIIIRMGSSRLTSLLVVERNREKVSLLLHHRIRIDDSVLYLHFVTKIAVL